ncbi:MarR family winged helix-turn-helix transcriptional regulator [Actinomadura sp. J1-007]|uniref:MarR family winged helix-turn-helix transcriptional regulator n=1 Tax=Actinomadura sp. J1-007 TaxID=2661913 RepID=UPI0019D5191B|nr:MarR family transcriptional regulator [Actinomadura sp. J1-007]
MWSEQPEKRSEQPERTDPELPDLFLRAAKRIRRRQSRELAPLGLTPAQSRALRVIVGSRVPLRMVDLAGQLDIVPRSATSIVDALESAGLVTRAPDPANRRSLLVQPTPRAARSATACGPPAARPSRTSCRPSPTTSAPPSARCSRSSTPTRNARTAANPADPRPCRARAETRRRERGPGG